MEITMSISRAPREMAWIASKTLVGVVAAPRGKPITEHGIGVVTVVVLVVGEERHEATRGICAEFTQQD